jgi:sugar phosphate permease
MAWALPTTAFLGSLCSGIISDKLVSGRRAPVATVLYFAQAVFILMALFGTQGGPFASLGVALALIIGINTACNATHSILGTAAAMDLGGRKMAGFASGVIDSFQYYGSFLAGLGLGSLIDHFAAAQAVAQTAATTAPAGQPETLPLHAGAWFASMLPFGILGTFLMGYLWFKHRGTDTRGT